MPIQYNVREGGLCIETMMRGELRSNEIKSYIQDLMADPRVKPGYSNLVDLRCGTVPKRLIASLDTYHALLLNNPKRTPNSRIAVVTDDGFAFRVARFFGNDIVPSNGRMIVFNDIGPARTWLGLA